MTSEYSFYLETRFSTKVLFLILQLDSLLLNTLVREEVIAQKTEGKHRHPYLHRHYSYCQMQKVPEVPKEAKLKISTGRNLSRKDKSLHYLNYSTK